MLHLQLYITLDSVLNFRWSQRCAYGLVRIRLKNHLVRVRVRDPSTSTCSVSLI